MISEMLLIANPSIGDLYKEFIEIAHYFVVPVFLISVILEFLGELNFGESLKKLLIVTLFLNFFYGFHQSGVEIAMESADALLKRVTPHNFILKKWNESKLKTKSETKDGIFSNFVIPNVNDFLATAFFVFSKIFLWLLKLIYSSVYHLTYLFSGFTAVLYFLGWTKDALKGTVQASIWCFAMPFVIVAILALVGNTLEVEATRGDILLGHIDALVWLFGITMLLMFSPMITYGLIRGDGAHSVAGKLGAWASVGGFKVWHMSRELGKNFRSHRHVYHGVKRKFSQFKTKETKE
jgi:hypothetical protein